MAICPQRRTKLRGRLTRLYARFVCFVLAPVVDDLESRIADLETDKIDQADIDALADDLENKISDVENDVEDKADQSEVIDLAGRIDALESDLGDKADQSEVDDIERDLSKRLDEVEEAKEV